MNQSLLHFQHAVPSARLPLLGSASIAVVVTFGLFAGMQYLIQNDNAPNVTPKPPIYVSAHGWFNVVFPIISI